MRKKRQHHRSGPSTAQRALDAARKSVAPSQLQQIEQHLIEQHQARLDRRQRELDAALYEEELQVRDFIANPDTPYQEQLSAKKYLLQLQLPGAPLTQEFLLEMFVSDEGKGLEATRLLWNCQHREVCMRRDRTEMRRQLSQPFVVWHKLSHHTQKADLFSQLQLQTLIDLAETESELTEDSPEIQVLRDRAIAAAPEIQRIFWIDISPTQSGKHIAEKLLDLFGYRLTSNQQTTFKVTSLYSLEHRQQIFDALDRRWSEDFMSPANTK